MSTWTETFPYSDGALTLNAGWAQLGNYNVPLMASGNVQISYTGSYSGALNATDVPGFLVGSPWTLTAIVKAQGASDLGGFLALFIGDDYSTPELTATLRFAPDGLSNNELSNVQIIDATGFIETGAPVAFASGTDHTIVLAYDGTDLTLTIDNVLILTKTNADITAVPAQVGLNGRTEDPADLWIISQMSLVYTSSGETITIHVTDGTYNLEGASVTLGTDTQTTDASGIATFTAVADGSHSLAITKSGFAFTTTSIDTDSSHTSFTEVMTRTNIFELVAMDVVSTLTGMDGPTYGFIPLVRRRGKACNPTSKNTASDGTPYTVEVEVQENRIEQQQPDVYSKSYYVMHLTLVCFISQSDTSTTSIDTLYNQVYTGLTIALMADAQRSGYATDTAVGDMLDQISFDGAYEAMTVDLRIQVRTDQFNPLSL